MRRKNEGAEYKLGTGVKRMVTDLQMCSEFCQTHDIVFVVDAIQGLGVLPIDVKKVHIDFLVSGFF